MRELNKKQKGLLIEWFKENKNKVGSFFKIGKCDDFPFELLQRLEEINNHETIVQNINRFLGDLSNKELIE